MVLNTGDSEDKPVVENNMQFFVLRPEPANANVYVDDEQVPIENGLFSATMPKGEHTYRVEAPMYQPDAGIVTLGSEQVIKSVTLKPKFGYVEIFSLPEQDADVYIDSVLASESQHGTKGGSIRIVSGLKHDESIHRYFRFDSRFHVEGGTYRFTGGHVQ